MTGAPFGLGVDIVEISRVRRLARRAPRFLPRVFTSREIAYCRSKKNPWPHFAVRFAAKEAVWKALGRAGIALKDIEVDRCAECRGVWFDVGNGQTGHMRWDTVEAIMKTGFWPDTFSTDWNVNSPTTGVIDFPNCMSKLLSFGMTVPQAIARATTNAARSFAVFRDRGTLNVGAVADVALLELRDGNFLRVGRQSFEVGPVGGGVGEARAHHVNELRKALTLQGFGRDAQEVGEGAVVKENAPVGVERESRGGGGIVDRAQNFGVGERRPWRAGL